MEKQTAVEWLFKELLNSEPNILEWNKLLEQAKEMHKQEIIKAAARGYLAAAYSYSERFKLEDGKDYAEQYYNETFGE
jgi:hypothetical protein